MEELNPPPLDLKQINPGPEAEPIAALTFLLELPHCLRIEEVIFLVSDRGGSWPGWNPHAIGYMAGFERAAPEDDLQPRFKVHIKQIRIDGWVPLLAAEKAFRGWQEVERPRRPPPGERTNCGAWLCHMALRRFRSLEWIWGAGVEPSI